MNRHCLLMPVILISISASLVEAAATNNKAKKEKPLTVAPAPVATDSAITFEPAVPAEPAPVAIAEPKVESSFVEKLAPNIGIEKENAEVTGAMLNKLLADFYVLYVKVQNYHWNVVGPMFNDLHLFFGTLYADLATLNDKIAERVRALGIRAKGTLAEFGQQARIKEEPGVYPAEMQMIRNLLADYESIIRTIRSALENLKQMDAGTNNMLQELLPCLEKKAWMLRSYLQ